MLILYKKAKKHSEKPFILLVLLWRCGMFDIQRLAFSFTETICMWALMVGNLPFFRKLPWPRSRHLTPQRILAYIGLEFNFGYIKSNHN